MKSYILPFKFILPTILGLAIVFVISASLLPSAGMGDEKSDKVADIRNEGTAQASARKEINKMGKLNLTEAEWQKRLTDEEFRILRKKGTERPFTGKYWDEKREGVYTCAGCGQKLFPSATKFKSGTGWPSYYQPVQQQAVTEEEDNSLFTTRTEVLCSRCGGHLGHVFNDGPKPTGLRYCINSGALDFIPEDDSGQEEDKEEDK